MPVPHDRIRPALSPKRLAIRLLAAPLAYRLLRRRAHQGDPVTILCYHTLRPDDDELDVWTALRMSDFRAQMAFLREHYEIVPLEEALDHRERRGRPRAMVTFDDGEVGLFRHLLPFVEQERLPVTVYIATGQVETGRPYWFDAVMNALQARRELVLDLREVGLGNRRVRPGPGPARWLDISAVLEALKSVDPVRREEVAARIVAATEGESKRSFRPLAPMSVDEVRRLARSRWVTIGSHSHCHNLLDRIPAADAGESLVRSRTLLEAWTGQPVRHFAYPNGNHDPTVRRLVAQTGHRSAAALGDAFLARGADPYALPRLGIGRYDSPGRFALRLIGI
jgi:peptidoglycan/xylan/chitin deacetylase (PgdA/CDA1 family)